MKSFKFFIRQRLVLLMYREFVKKTSPIPDISTKQEQRNQIRQEFDTNKDIPEENIEYYLAKGTHKLKELDSMINLIL